MSTNSRIAKVYPKHFDPNPEAIWNKIEAKLSNQQEEEDNEDTEFDLSDLSSNDE